MMRTSLKQPCPTSSLPRGCLTLIVVLLIFRSRTVRWSRMEALSVEFWSIGGKTVTDFSLALYSNDVILFSTQTTLLGCSFIVQSTMNLLIVARHDLVPNSGTTGVVLIVYPSSSLLGL
ncbi:uncharacterized protein BO88DRAFT_90554 [Aspergillus vadensis CBS 113365]|uniref:Uncharacterized protein n=1 Tax=Aspergillus vadensis (strain CBS 113365 / IMI 142717 / IBT 24658) TaxID=1448311 RepID=A0A319BV46_ASPVC|nr:hypothetical protein BO88DRAFT_90554 [Aspergillus vadensis CBS 113365]PYH66998.1 hypothetical protein BO88DRAFT_90554 [Aspergillus vadensis CBS 113365]